MERQIDERGASARPRVPPNRRRDKPQLSCHACRRRKLKCNRSNPCSNCQKSGIGLSCAYAYAPASGLSRSAEDAGTLGMTGQLSSGTEGNTSVGSSPPENDGANASKTCYREGFHWSSVLKSISDIDGESDQMNAAQEAVSQPQPQHVNRLLLGATGSSSRQELLASLPTRSQADRLVAFYFEVYDYSPVILHRGEFLKQYQEFWRDPTTATVAWIGLLYSVICLSTVFRYANVLASGKVTHQDAHVNEDAKHLEVFRNNIVQALILAQYGKGGPFIIETLLQFIMVEQYIRRDADSDTWMVLGNLIQIALRGGYHKDPSRFKNLSPFEGEMRRRLWLLIYQLDMGVAVQLGMPKLIRDSIIDTQEPRNLFDSDINSDTSTLPPSRPETELTPILIAIAKHRIAFVCSASLDLVSGPAAPSYSEVLELDRRLAQTFLQLPDCCKFTSMSESILDPPNLICHRLFIQSIYYHVQLALHSRYLLHSEDYEYSTQAAVAAAIRSLKYHHLIDKEIQPDGRLASVKWVLSPVVINGFLLASSILCSYVSHYAQSMGDENLQSIRALLEKSGDIWERSSARSAEAGNAGKAIRRVLQRTESPPSVAEPVTMPPQQDFVEQPTLPPPMPNVLPDDPAWWSIDSQYVDPSYSGLLNFGPQQWF